MNRRAWPTGYREQTRPRYQGLGPGGGFVAAVIGLVFLIVIVTGVAIVVTELPIR